MGCLVGFAALAVAAGLGWLAHALGGSTLVIALVVAATLVVGLVPVVRYGHYGFGGGGSTDVGLYLLAVGIPLALILPRVASSIACGNAERHLEWIATAQADYRSENGVFAESVGALIAHVGEDSFDFSVSVVIELEEVTDSTYTATALHLDCKERGSAQLRSIDESWQAPGG